MKKPLVLAVLVPVVLVVIGGVVIASKQNPVTYEDLHPDIEPIEPELVVIPEGAFLMGDPGGLDWDQPVHEVYLSEFSIGKFEVTNEEYRRFCDATERPYPRDPEFAEGKSYLINNPRHPVVMVTWTDMAAYAKWLSARTGKDYHLPTEAQWEKAARGGLEGKIYPWGDEIDDSKVRLNLTWSAGTQEVGLYPPNGFGLYDMAGNVIEAVEDWFDENYYSKSPSRDPVGPSGWGNYMSLINPTERSRLKGRCKALRGGSFRAPWDWHQVGPDGLDEMPVRAGARGYLYQEPYDHFDLGFRLAEGGVWR